MKMLITAGNTQTAIDKVRCITNIFSGRTGTRIALEAFGRGHEVCLLTSHPDVVDKCSDGPECRGDRWRVRPYRSFADLQRLMEDEIVSGAFDAVIHVAAVSDYEVAGTYSLPDNTYFDAKSCSLNAATHSIELTDASAGKVKSNHQEVWLRLVPTRKLIDLVREPWGFQGTLVKFKLEVDVDRRTLARIAEESRRHSQADIIVANTLEGMASWALLGTTDKIIPVSREELSAQVIQRVEKTSQLREQYATVGLTRNPFRN
jgi:phosphopantothenoylcysteine synthetase/decarboxylase